MIILDNHFQEHRNKIRKTLDDMVSNAQESYEAEIEDDTAYEGDGQRNLADRRSSDSRPRPSIESEGFPMSQSELISHSMQQKRSPSPLTSSGIRSDGVRQSLPSAQFTTSRQARVGSSIHPRGIHEGVDPSTARMRHWVIVLGLIILICIGVTAIVVPLYMKPQYDINSVTIPASPTLSPSVGSTGKPTILPTKADVTLAPTTAAFANFVQDFGSKISGSSVFNDPTSPHYKAANYIANVAGYTTNDEAMMGDFYAVTLFYFSTGGDSWKECSRGSDNCPDGVSWMTSNITYCNWSWISCNEASRVVDVVFSNVDGNNLVGTLSSELALLTELERFVIVNDSIEGPLPKEIGSLTHITHFIVASNSINGEISDSFLVDSPLEVFMVSDNQLNGEIPESLTKMSSAYQIFIDNNRFSGPIPDGFGSLPNLATLDLTGNRFEGTIPDSIFSSSIQNLYLGRSTRMDGGVSPAVGNARNLVRLHIVGTRVSGGLPDDLFTLPYLTELILSNNTLTGTLSKSVASLGRTLEVMMLDGNKFSGDLPSESIDELALSKELTFARNSFTGVISSKLCERRGKGYHDLNILTVDCQEVACTCCNNCSPS